jgi:hypothetical protein
MRNQLRLQEATLSEALEITTFKLLSGLKLKDFIAANNDIDPWLQKQPGFIWRRIGMRSDGYVVDALLWASTRDAKLSAVGIVTEMSESPVHGTIDHNTVDWIVVECPHVLLAAQS